MIEDKTFVNRLCVVPGIRYIYIAEFEFCNKLKWGRLTIEIG
jgi:hypothetical protein